MSGQISRPKTGCFGRAAGQPGCSRRVTYYAPSRIMRSGEGNRKMSNVKDVSITGTLPFDCDNNTNLMPFLAAFNGPVFGLKLKWSPEHKMVANEFGGQTAMYNFEISGHEAVAWGWLHALKDAIVGAGGSIASYAAEDFEARMNRMTA